MASVVLDHQDKRDSQIFIENLQNADPTDSEKLLDFHNFAAQEPAWHRFAKGAYNHPVTWWVGLLQIQMQMGIWGHKRKAEAQLRSSTLGQVIRLGWNNSSVDMLHRVLVYNLKHRKADISGRLVGSRFTRYASTGGKIGNKKFSNNAKAGVSLSNFLLATYGSSIKSVATGHNKIEEIIQTILTGRPDGPSPYPDIYGYEYAKHELQMYETLKDSLTEIEALTQLAPSPVPMDEFCLRRENINIEGLCK